MATLKQLHTARGAGLKLAHALQDFAQVDIKTANIENADVAAGIKAAADQAVAAATAIGGDTAPLPATQVVVSNADTVPVKNSAGTAVGAAAVLTVAGGVLTEAKLPATTAAVLTNSTVAVQNSAGVSAGTGTVTVSGGGVSNVKLPATVAPVTAGLSPIAATGTGTKVTFTVANGAITAITLSA